ncbi:MAG TPA: response regulator transcription factor [Gammaproteobacteria bacterium]|nr:response regulator transcription factor [Gammaproteobacteria bacterium]
MNQLQASPPGIAGINRMKYPSTPNSTRIFIIGHQDFSLDSLASMLESAGDNYLVSCVEPGDTCMARLLATEPDVLLIQNEALKEPVEPFILGILEKFPDIRFLVFGKNMSDDHLYRLVRCGVHGYVNERMNGDHIKRALESVTGGRTWIERHIMERFISTQHDFDQVMEAQFYARIEKLCTALTRRETEILCEVLKGLAIKQIAEKVHLSHQGVKMHLAKLFRKFKVSNRNQLILAAFDEISPVRELSVLLRNGLTRQMEAAD